MNHQHNKIAIVNYRSCNCASIQNMLRRLGHEAVVANEMSDLNDASGLILPGVGSYDSGMGNLIRYGFIDRLEEMVLQDKIPILGICLGMQLMTKSSDEGKLPGLGWIDGTTKKFRFNDTTIKVPHMGWNGIDIVQAHCLFKDMYADPRFYFVHSYYVNCLVANDVLATTNYGHEFTSSFRHDNIMGVQFHPEKSHKFGMKVLQNFAEQVSLCSLIE